MIQWFAVCMCHLKPVEGMVTPKKVNPTSTHELVIAEFDPESYLFEALDPTQIAKYTIVSPFIFEAQLDNLQDAEANLLTDLLVSNLLDGTLTPDHDTKKKWFEIVHENQKWLSQR